jgi:putative transposase
LNLIHRQRSRKVRSDFSAEDPQILPAAKYVVDLTLEERQHRLDWIRRGTPATRRVTRARLRLKAAQGWTDEPVAVALEVGSATVGRGRQRFVEDGLEAALAERPRPGKPRKLTGPQEAHLRAIAGTPAPTGHARWTRKRLADKVVELGFAERSARETLRQGLKKTNLNRGARSRGACPR